MKLLQKGNKERTQEPTAANKTSSRSHALLMVNVKQTAKSRQGLLYRWTEHSADFFEKITTGGGLLLDHVFVVGGTGLGWQQDFLRLDSESS